MMGINRTEESIYIPDPNLRRVLEKMINPPSLRNRSLSEKTLKKVRHLYMDNEKIRDLSGIEWCKNVESLYLMDNPIEDLSPLYALKKLRILDVSRVPYIRWWQLTEPFSSVEELYLRSCELESDSLLRLFPNVRIVSLFHNHIEHIDTLYSLPHLESVDLRHNPIPDTAVEAFHNHTGVGFL